MVSDIGVSVQQPMVYVYEKERWEYKVVTKNASGEEPLSEPELNALGAAGWELVGVVALAGMTHFYFKRLQRWNGLPL